MAEWLYEAGIGEDRAALVEEGAIVAAAVELVGTLTVGTVAAARLSAVTPAGQAVVTLGDGQEALLARVPPATSIGRTLTVAVTREAIPEPGRPKRARAVPSEALPALGPDLLARLAATGHPIRHLAAHQPDALEAAGWSELLDEATTGEIAFAGGALRVSPTPAMTLIDIDGAPPAETLALAGAVAAARAIRRLGIGGSIGIDLPTVAGKAPRQAVAAAIDAHLPQPFERTTMNGFGFLQVVRPRPRPSLPELLRADPVGTAARAALRTLERTPPTAPRHHRLPPAVLARIAAHPEWLAELVRRTGVTPVLESA